MVSQPPDPSQKCPTCHGIGRVYKKTGNISGADPELWATKPCPDCDGTGYVNDSPPDPSQAELDEALSNHENLCENQSKACGDCRRLKADLTAWAERSAKRRELDKAVELLGEVAAQARENGGTLWYYHIDDRIAELTKELTALQQQEKK